MKKILSRIVVAIFGILFFSLPIIGSIAGESGIIGLILFLVFCYIYLKIANSKKFNEMLDESEK